VLRLHLTDYGQVQKMGRPVIGNSSRARVAQRASRFFLGRRVRERERERGWGGVAGDRRIGASRSVDDDESTRAASSAV